MSAASAVFRFVSRLIALFRRRRLDRELQEDLENHLDLLAREQIQRGFDADSARREARRQMGSLADAVESHRDARSLRFLETVVQDARYGVRSLLKYRWQSLTSIATLVVAVGLVTSVATTFNAVFLRPWPVVRADEVFVAALVPGGRQVTYREFESLRTGATRSRLVASHRFGAHIGEGQRVSDERGLVVTPDFFEILGIRIAHGRAFVGPTTSGVREAVISDALWRRLFGGDPGIIGTVMSLNDLPTRIVGVLGPAFRGIPPERSDVYVPFPSSDAWDRSWASWWVEGAPSAPTQLSVSVAGRLVPGRDREDAQAELQVLYGVPASTTDRSAGGVPETPAPPEPVRQLELFSTVMAQSPVDGLRDEVPAIFALLFAAAILVLVVASANLANLQLARNLVRSREISTRLALGAAPRRVARQLLTEGLLLAGLAGAGALAVAAVLPSLVLGEEGAATALAFTPDARVFLFALALCVGTAMLFALLPALQATRAARPLSGLQGGRSGGPIGRARRWILALQVAVSMVLVLGATLLVRDLRYAVSTDHLGYPTDILTATLHSPDGTLIWNAPDASFVPQLLDGLEPSSNDITLAAPGPFEPQFPPPVRLPGMAEEDAVRLVVAGIRSNFFSFLGVPLVSGRMFVDLPEGNEIVVNQAFMRAFAPGAVGLGSQVVIRDATRTIVGIVPDLRLQSVETIWPTVFQPLLGTRVPTILLRPGHPASRAQLDATVASIDPDLGIETRSLADLIAEDTAGARLGALLASLLGLAALGLASLGVFGVFGCLVEERRREIGIRLALGATGGRIMALLFEGARKALVPGLAGGIALSIAAIVLLRGFMYGLNPLDPWSYVVVGGILTVSGVVATWFPARRAVQIDPAATLRSE